MPVPNEIIDYIRANRDTYTREAIVKQLREAGHSIQDIEAAWQVVERQAVESKVRYHVSGYALGCYVVTLIALLLVGALAMYFTFAFWGELAAILVTLVSVVAAVGMIWIASVLLKRKWPVSRAMAVTVAIALVWYLVLYGICTTQL
jgi:predicted RND superfamily exporter protein